MRDTRAARLGKKKKEKKRKRGTSVFDLDSRARTVAAIRPAFTVLGAPQGALRHREFTGDERRGFWSSFFIAAVIQDIARRMGMRAANDRFRRYFRAVISARRFLLFLFIFTPLFFFFFKRRIYVRGNIAKVTPTRLLSCVRGFSFWRFLEEVYVFSFFFFFSKRFTPLGTVKSCESLEIFSKSLLASF